MCGEAYYQSAAIAESTGPFPGFAVNEEPMTRVVKKHWDAVADISKHWDAINEDPIFKAADVSWQQAYELGKKHGWRNSQVTVLAPTG
ncbi:hypothetical protein, partial [uncultured Microbacterium sp.]|uniref:hypothetical protein n=1 Tax=uncultured Microbacterium sp. TaxID=191216 RepID=UPI00338E4ACC